MQIACCRYQNSFKLFILKLMEIISGDITLRSFRKTDADLIVPLANNRNVSRNLRDGFPHPYTRKDAVFFIGMCLEKYKNLYLAIEYKNQYVGNISLTPCQDVYRRSAEIGYFIGEPYWNKGIATAAVKLMVAYGFEQLNLVRIHTGIFEFNPASGKVLEKCGFQKEGIFRKSVTKEGKLWDEVRYALINPAYL